LLEIASAASTRCRVWARGVDAIGARLDDLDRLGPQEAGPSLCHARAHALAGEGQSHEDHLAAVKPPDSASGGRSIDAHIDHVVDVVCHDRQYGRTKVQVTPSTYSRAVPGGLRVHVAESLEGLADTFASLESERSTGPLDPLWVVVPSAPIRQWLDWLMSTRLGESAPGSGDGVASNLRYLFPEEFVRLVEEAALGTVGAERVGFDVGSMALALKEAAGHRYPRARSLAESIDVLVRWRPDFVEGATDVPAAAEEARHALGLLTGAKESPIAQRARVLDALRHARVPSLPPRVVMFGSAAVPGGPGFAQLVAALASHCEIDVLAPAASATGALGPWSREFADAAAIWSSVGATVTRQASGPRATATHLDALRAQIRGEAASAARDGTVRLVGAVGLSRQAEIARDIILEAISEGTEPHHVVVVAPDDGAVREQLERHWNHDRAAAAAGAPRLPFEVVDVSVANADTRVEAAADLLRLARGYARVDELVRFLSRAPVMSFSGLETSDIERLEDLADALPVTFGVSLQHRRQLDVYASDEGLGSWEELSDEAAEAWWAASSHGAITPEDAAIVARIQPALRAIDTAVKASTTSRPLGQWLDLLRELIDDVAEDDDDGLDRVLLRTRQWADPGPELDFEEFVALYRDVAASASRQRAFGRGGVVVASPTSMPFAPYKMVVILGLDESALPQATLDDAVMGPERRGDPDHRRSVLGALLAWVSCASERLVVTFNDRHESTGRPAETAVPLEELASVVAAAASSGRADVLETSPRHAFAVNHDGPLVVSNSFDRRLAGAPTGPSPGRLANQSVRDQWPSDAGGLDIPVESVREFLRGPSAFFARRVLGAATLPEAREDPDIPPIDITGLERSALQREYVNGLTAALLAQIGLGGAELFPTETHPASVSCAELSCSWLHRPAFASMATLSTVAGRHRLVPPRLWRRRMHFEVLDLFAYNMACDLSELGAVVGTDALVASPEVQLDDGSFCRTQDAAAILNSLQLRDELHHDQLVMTRYDLRASSGPRQLLADAFDVAWATLITGRSVRLDRFRPPERTDRYKKLTGVVPAGAWALNPVVSLRISEPLSQAEAVIRALAGIAQRATAQPVALFRRSSVLASVGALSASGGRPNRLEAAKEWTGGWGGFGERSEWANALLFPLSPDELEAMGDGRFPYVDDLRGALAPFLVTAASQSTRLPARVVREGERTSAVWSGAKLEAAAKERPMVVT
jgi:hypothetical protein